VIAGGAGDDAAVAARLAGYFSALSRADLDRLADHYAADAHFKDPFNEVDGLPAIRAIYAHMFAQLDAPRFEIHDALAGPGRCALTWTMHFRRRGAATGAPAQQIRGASLLHLDAAGRITLHRDYWDPAEELYEGLPLLGTVLRAIKRRLATP